MAEPAWMEVSLTVDGELAEAVAEVLARFAPNGVVIESTQILPDPEGEGIPTGPLRVCAYLPVDEKLEETRGQVEEALWYLGRAWPENPPPPPQFTPLQEINWVETWKQHYRPIAVGERLMIVPAWIEMDPAGRVPIRMEPGMAFGTGTHPTTQLCLEMVEAYLADAPVTLNHPLADVAVIDVGSGSGILSVAALLLGAKHALGVDVDPEAVPVSRENAARNGVTDRLELGVGSVGELLAGQFSLQQAPLVLANILAHILVRLLDQGLSRLVAPGGRLVLSGILTDQWEGEGGTSPLKEALQAHGLSVLEVRQQGDWVAVSAG